MSIEFFVMLRDACEKELERLRPTETINITAYNPENIFWVRTTGKNGPYERYPAYQQQADTTNQDYNNLLADIKQHKNKLSRAGLFYWIFQDNITIGRKPTTK